MSGKNVFLIILFLMITIIITMVVREVGEVERDMGRVAGLIGGAGAKWPIGGRGFSLLAGWNFSPIFCTDFHQDFAQIFTNILHRFSPIFCTDFHQDFASIFTKILHQFSPRFCHILWIKQAAQYLQIVLLPEPAPSVNNQRQNDWKKDFTNIWLQRCLGHRGWCAACLVFQRLQWMLTFTMWSGKCLVWWMLCNPLIYKLSCWRSCSQLANLCFWHNNLLAQLKPFTNLSPFINNCHPTRPMFNDFCKNIVYAPVALSGELHKCGWIIWHQLECWPSTDQPGEKPPTINVSHCFETVSSKWR